MGNLDIQNPVAEHVSPELAAARWNVSVDTIRRLIRSGRVDAYRLNGRIIRVNLAQVDAAFEPIEMTEGGRK
ncbi:excisionase family DNA-binding protein [Propionimicrobium sp. PCR01-08-3]|uniref:excisionase family DNA-binding protein n=1 Tax=Propionimicrobium sp. PCR01-08-3 TaxID=3052086 RepID=UPI00255CA9A4|nr:excisionase family DNA-binding protein [Propionimicrobium sp. PCR01-08-3]WIY81392.1 excisionase family DNA-binding protein [Propionimicrobium sp. PCR01-08-3]